MTATLAPGRQELRLRIAPLEAPLGADVFDFPFADFTDAEFAAVHRAWLDRCVLRFRGIDISDQDQIRFSARLGPFVIHPRQMQQGQQQPAQTRHQPAASSTRGWPRRRRSSAAATASARARRSIMAR